MTRSTPPQGPAAVTTWREVPTQTVDVEGTPFAYRRLGAQTGVPLVFLHHFTAVLDDWDPRIIDGLAATRPVITFDNRAIGRTGGSVPHTVEEMARDATAFIRALGLEEVDLLGFSLGGGVTQVIALDEPALVRKPVLAGAGPAGGGGITRVTRVAAGAYLRGALTFKDPKHYLFFPQTAAGKRAGTEYMARLKERTQDRDKRITPWEMRAQLKTIAGFGRRPPHDPNASLLIYPASGHGGVFQYRHEFVPAVAAFLDAD